MHTESRARASHCQRRRPPLRIARPHSHRMTRDKGGAFKSKSVASAADINTKRGVEQLLQPRTWPQSPSTRRWHS
jgi:hypothetical protein